MRLALLESLALRVALETLVCPVELEQSACLESVEHPVPMDSQGQTAELGQLELRDSLGLPVHKGRLEALVLPGSKDQLEPLEQSVHWVHLVTLDPQVLQGLQVLLVHLEALVPQEYLVVLELQVGRV